MARLPKTTDRNIIRQAVEEVKGDLRLFATDIKRDFGKKERPQDTPLAHIRRLLNKEG